ncbi:MULTISPECIES: hypothetical protein [Heyndrickxia]|uniref:hypothetical protein n=1 Tax=Heyndrickxia TaxID=2837504 RepID=UPI0003754593|nr:hypothetical protein [Heyndrickxia coagulans]
MSGSRGQTRSFHQLPAVLVEAGDSHPLAGLFVLRLHLADRRDGRKEKRRAAAIGEINEI